MPEMMMKAYCNADGEWSMMEHGMECEMRRRMPNHVDADGNPMEMPECMDGMMWMAGMWATISSWSELLDIFLKKLDTWTTSEVSNINHGL